MTKIVATVIASILVAFAYVLTAAPTEPVKVDGGLVAGVADAGVRSHKGIPYAAPPVGEWRWKAPAPVVAWQGVRPGDTFGAHCVQQPYAETSPYYFNATPQSEDCLYLNVWTAANAGARRPV